MTAGCRPAVMIGDCGLQMSGDSDGTVGNELTG